MDILIGILLFVLGIVVYLIGYLLVPLIVASSAKLTKAQINLIVICNVVVVFILFQLWNPYLITNIVMGIISLFAARRILISKCLKTDGSNIKTDAVRREKTYICVSEEGALASTDRSHNTYGSDIMLAQAADMPSTGTVKHESQPNVQSVRTSPSVSKVAVKYCSRCGNAIDSTTKMCTGCGKQYFKGFSWKASLVVLGVLIVVSFAANIVLYFSNTELLREIAAVERGNSVLEAKNLKLEEDIASLKKSNDAYFSFYEENHDKLEVLDSWVVFVENDGSQLYHKYECYKFVGADCWSHNIEYAEYLGYKPCPLCFD